MGLMDLPPLMRKESDVSGDVMEARRHLQNPPKGLWYVNVVPLANVIVEPSPPVC